MSFILINIVFWIKWFIVYRIRRSISKSYFRTSPKIAFWKEMVYTFWKCYSSYYCICLLFWKVWCKTINLKILEMIFQKMSTYFNFCSSKYTFILSQEKFLLALRVSDYILNLCIVGRILSPQYSSSFIL